MIDFEKLQNLKTLLEDATEQYETLSHNSETYKTAKKIAELSDNLEKMYESLKNNGYPLSKFYMEIPLESKHSVRYLNGRTEQKDLMFTISINHSKYQQDVFIMGPAFVGNYHSSFSRIINIDFSETGYPDKVSYIYNNIQKVKSGNHPDYRFSYEVYLEIANKADKIFEQVEKKIEADLENVYLNKLEKIKEQERQLLEEAPEIDFLD